MPFPLREWKNYNFLTDKRIIDNYWISAYDLWFLPLDCERDLLHFPELPAIGFRNPDIISLQGVKSLRLVDIDSWLQRTPQKSVERLDLSILPVSSNNQNDRLGDPEMEPSEFRLRVVQYASLSHPVGTICSLVPIRPVGVWKVVEHGSGALAFHSTRLNRRVFEKIRSGDPFSVNTTPYSNFERV